MKIFNVTVPCNPTKHYMVDISDRLEAIKELVDQGAYFTINRARQYGKTTTLRELCKYLQQSYYVVYMDFQMEMSDAKFKTENTFSTAFAKSFLRRFPEMCSKDNSGLDNAIVDELACAESVPSEIVDELCKIAEGKIANINLRVLFKTLSKWCKISQKPIVLIIDEVDSATNNQVFLDFLAQIRGYYLDREIKPTFQSVILAGVHDVKNIKSKIRHNDDHKLNSPGNTRENNEESGSLLTFDECSRDYMAKPYNIATKFDINMSLNFSGIEAMLEDYEADHHIGMNTAQMAQSIYDYTSGYPFLVSRLCQILDILFFLVVKKFSIIRMIRQLTLRKCMDL